MRCFRQKPKQLVDPGTTSFKWHASIYTQIFLVILINTVVLPDLSVVESRDVEEPLVPKADSKF